MQVAGACSVGYPDGGVRGADGDRVAVHHDRATLAAGERRRLDFETNGLHGLVEALDLEQRDDLLLIGEQDVDMPAHQFLELLEIGRASCRESVCHDV